jgi:hypothetical protein
MASHPITRHLAAARAGGAPTTPGHPEDTGGWPADPHTDTGCGSIIADPAQKFSSIAGAQRVTALQSPKRARRSPDLETATPPLLRFMC